MRTALRIAAALLAGGAMSGPTLAEEQVRVHCKAEIVKYCPSVPHGAGAVPVCLSGPAANISKTCRAALSNKGPGWGRMADTGGGAKKGRVITECRKEIAEFCDDVSHGGTAIPACLNKHLGELSHACKIVLAIKGPVKKGGDTPK